MSDYRLQATLSVMLLVITAARLGAQSLPDPTRPYAYNESTMVDATPPELVDWKVTAIRITDTDRSAIVNGRLVRPGDNLGRARIVEIQSRLVMLEYENRLVPVRLFPELGAGTSIQPVKTMENTK